MKVNIILILLFCTTYLFGQDTLKFDYYSEDYKLLVISKECNKDSCFGESNIYISNRKTNKLISKIKVDNFLADNSYVTQGKINNQIPFAILYDDYNFDNVNDIAIRNGYAKNGNPKYDFYLMNKALEIDSVLTSLSEKYGNVFTSPEKKILRFITVSIKNYRIREIYNYSKTDNKLQLIEKRIEDGKSNPKYMTVTTESNRNNKKTVERKKYLIGKYQWDEI